MTTVDPAPEPTPETPATIVAAQISTLMDFIDVRATLDWRSNGEATSPGEGLITSVSVTDFAIQEGDELVRIDELPVVALQGHVPLFRDLSPGDRGRDVGTLQQHLLRLGYIEFEPDRVFGAATAGAVQQWREDRGLSRRPEFLASFAVTLPELPARAELHEDVTIGSLVAVGDPLLQLLPSQPTIRLDASTEQTQLGIASSGLIELDMVGEWVEGRLGVAQISEDGNRSSFPIVIEGPAEGGCGVPCGTVAALGAETFVRARVVIVPETTGTSVPTASLSTSGGVTSVRLADTDQLRGVDVLAQARGIAIVTGIDVGERIIVPRTGEELQ